MTMYDKITEPIKSELKAFNDFYKNAYRSENKYVEQVINISVSTSGKQMRPLLVLLTSALCGGINHRTLVGATLAEMIHTASLIHDDVVDEAYHRRDELSVNALFRSRKAVLIGDFVLARGINMITDQDQLEILKIISKSLENLCEGELLQMQHADRLDTTEEIYFDIITKKTAVLLSACAEIGAKSACNDEATIKTMKQFGELLGVMFQIKDDIFDYEAISNIGKDTCNDLMEQKITLPLIHLLNNSDKKQYNHIMKMLSDIRQTPDNAYLIRTMVEESGGIDYAEHKMLEIRDQAIKLLDIFEESAVKDAMTNYVNFIVNRTK